jgi:hypothetical protein
LCRVTQNKHGQENAKPRATARDDAPERISSLRVFGATRRGQKRNAGVTRHTSAPKFVNPGPSGGSTRPSGSGARMAAKSSRSNSSSFALEARLMIAHKHLELIATKSCVQPQLAFFRFTPDGDRSADRVRIGWQDRTHLLIDGGCSVHSGGHGSIYVGVYERPLRELDPGVARRQRAFHLWRRPLLQHARCDASSRTDPGKLR